MKHKWLSKILIGVAAVIATAMITACNSDECYQNKNALPLAGFYSSQPDHAKLTVDSIQVTGVGVPGDSVLSTGKSRISELYLPFRLDSDTTKYLFRYIRKDLAAYGLRDTITFIYSREPRFVSSACGVSYAFVMKEIRHTSILIDSVACPAGEITNMATQNLQIYFRTEESD